MLSSENQKRSKESASRSSFPDLRTLIRINLENKEITETFPLETLGSVALRVDSTPWFADFTNYHAGNFIVKGMSSQQKNKHFWKDVKHNFWDDPFLFQNLCGSSDLCVVVARQESSRHTSIACHKGPHRGHHGSKSYPKKDCPDFEASRARGFCPLITRASHPQLQFGNPIS
ncbi:hypothetical protein Tco_0547609 [Tanacetum coccineum]